MVEQEGFVQLLRWPVGARATFFTGLVTITFTT
jgi:hypothetical protein